MTKEEKLKQTFDRFFVGAAAAKKSFDRKITKILQQIDAEKIRQIRDKLMKN